MSGKEDRDPLNAIQFEKRLDGGNVELSARLTWAGAVLIDMERDRPEIIEAEKDRMRRMMAVNIYGHVLPDVRAIRDLFIEFRRKHHEIEFTAQQELQAIMSAIQLLADKLDGQR